MDSRQEQFGSEVESGTYSLGEQPEHLAEPRAMALLTLSHTPVEQQLYLAMREQTASLEQRFATFTISRLKVLTGIDGYSAIRRGLCGLVQKRSIERQTSASGNGKRSSYATYSPTEIFQRRRQAGIAPYPEAVRTLTSSVAFGLALERVIRFHDLSRREAQVALCCAEGLSNSEIGMKLRIGEQTVKFHLRHIFIKFGVRRRAELVSRLLTQQAQQAEHTAVEYVR